MDITLQMFKIDLGINHTLRDEYFHRLIEGCKAELSQKGVLLDNQTTEDIMLLSDYAAWTYRKRMDNVPMAQSLVCRIRNRQVKGRVGNA